MEGPNPQNPSQLWKNQITKEQRSQIFKVVISNMKKQQAFSTWTEQELSTYTLQKMSEFWKEATSKEQFLEMVAKLADPKANPPPAFPPRGSIQAPKLPQPNPQPQPPLPIAQQPVHAPTAPVGQPVSPNGPVTAEEIQKYWEKIEVLKPMASYVQQYLDSFHKKRNDIQEGKNRQLSTLPPQDIQRIDRNLGKYDALIKQFQTVHDVMSGKIAPQSFVPAQHDITMLHTIESQIQKQTGANREKVSTVAPPPAVQTQQPPPLPHPVVRPPSTTPTISTPTTAEPVVQTVPSSTRDPTQRLIGILVGMEREYPRDLRLALGRIMDKIDTYKEEQDFFDAVLEDDKPTGIVESDSFLDYIPIASSDSKKRKRGDIATFNAEPSIFRLEEKPLKRVKTTPNRVTFTSVSNLPLLEKVLLDNINCEGFSVGGGLTVQPNIHLTPNTRDPKEFTVHCTVETLLCYIPEFTITIRLSDDEQADDILNMIPSRIEFDETPVDTLNDVFLKSKSLFTQKINHKRAKGMAYGSSNVRVPFVVQAWVTSVQDVIKNELGQ